MPVLTNTFMSAPNTTTAIEFRKWAQGIHDSLVACGLVQSTDTGQANLATMTVPANDIWTNYEVWRFNDTLQATKPIFFKIAYGNTIGAGRAAIQLTVGSASSGAGAISGFIYSAATTLRGDASTPSTEFPSYVSGDGSFINIIMWPGAGFSTLGGFTIGRSCDTSGAYSANALLVAHYAGTSPLFLVIGTAGSDPNVNCAKSAYPSILLPYTVNNVSASLGSTLSKDGTTAPVQPIPCMAPGVVPFVTNALAAIHPGDAGATSVIQVATINGSSRTFRAFPYIGTATTTGNGIVPMASDRSTVSHRCHAAIAWAV